MAFFSAEQEKEYYGQRGTNIPTFGIQSGYQSGLGTGIQPYFGSYVSDAPAPATNFLNNFIAQGPGFDLAPDIDSPIIDKWLQDYTSTPGYTKPVMPTPEEFQQRVRKLRSSLRPV